MAVLIQVLLLVAVVAWVAVLPSTPELELEVSRPCMLRTTVCPLASSEQISRSICSFDHAFVGGLLACGDGGDGGDGGGGCGCGG